MRAIVTLLCVLLATWVSAADKSYVVVRNDTTDAAEAASVLDIEAVEAVYHWLIETYGAERLGICFASAGPDSAGHQVDPPDSFFARMADTGVEFRPWSRHVKKPGKMTMRDRVTDERGVACRIKVLGHPTDTSVGVDVFLEGSWGLERRAMYLVGIVRRTCDGWVVNPSGEGAHR